MSFWEETTTTAKLKLIRPRKKRIQHRKRIKDMRNIQLGITIGAVLERTLNKFLSKLKCSLTQTQGGKYEV